MLTFDYRKFNVQIKHLHILRPLLISLFIIPLLSCGQSSKVEHVLKIAHILPTEHPVHMGLEKAKELIETKSNGSIRVDIYPSGILGSEPEMIEGLALGTISITKVSSIVLANFSPEAGVFGLPYLFKDTDHCWRVLNGSIGKDILNSALHYDVRGLCYFEAGARSFYTKEKPVLSPDDLTGLKVRVQQSPIMIATVRALGANPTPISYGELYTALSQGVVDAAENNIPSFYSSRHFEICPYFSFDRHSMVPDVVLISEVVWQNLGPKYQKIVQESFDEAVKYQIEVWNEKCDQYQKEMEKQGVTFYNPDTAPFSKKVESMYNEIDQALKSLAERIRKIQ